MTFILNNDENMNTFKTLSIDEIPTIEATRKRRIDKLIIHCSAVGPKQTSSARQIDAWHRAKGWQMIGYHYVIRRDGSIEIGRPADMIGAHTSGQNANSLGICYEGGLVEMKELKNEKMKELTPTDGHSSLLIPNSSLKPADTRTPEQKATLLALLKHLKTLYPNATIHGHNEFARKACPCFDARSEYAELLHTESD